MIVIVLGSILILIGAIALLSGNDKPTLDISSNSLITFTDGTSHNWESIP